MLKTFAVSVAFAGIVSTSAVSFAGDVTITQAKKKFDQAEVSMNAGQSLTFVNSDKVKHHVLADGLFEISQKPGASDTITVDKAGEYDVICAIHPKMQLKLKVK